MAKIYNLSILATSVLSLIKKNLLAITIKLKFNFQMSLS